MKFIINSLSYRELSPLIAGSSINLFTSKQSLDCSKPMLRIFKMYDHYIACVRQCVRVRAHAHACVCERASSGCVRLRARACAFMRACM